MNFDAINTFDINHSDAIAVSSQDAIVFDGYSLQSASFITSRLDYDDLWTVELNTFDFPRSDGGGVLSKHYRGRNIKLTGIIKAGSASEFNDLIDEIKTALRKTNGLLDITINGEIRQIKATVTSIVYNKDFYNITFSPINITFTTVEPFFYSKQRQSAGYFAKTATFTEEMTHNWGAEAQPIVYFLFWATTSATALSFTDPAGRTLSVATAITANDIIIIDSIEKTVTKNAVAIDYTGAFPIFSPWSNNFTISFTGTILADITVVLPKNYL